MFTITTKQTSNGSGAGIVIAKGHGKQRTVRYQHGDSVARNHGAAAGALLNVLTDDRQQAMVKHPSGAQRVTKTPTDNGSGFRFEVNV